MKITAYFFDKYTGESIWIAAVLWPLFFIPFYMFYHQKDNVNKTVIFPIIAALIMASFTCLVFADSLIQYLTFFFGVGLLVFGSMAMMNEDKDSLINWVIGTFTTVLAALILYLMRVHIYKRKSIPTSPGKVNTLMTGGSFVWIGVQLALYAYVAYVMLKD